MLLGILQECQKVLYVSIETRVVTHIYLYLNSVLMLQKMFEQVEWQLEFGLGSLKIVLYHLLPDL